MKQIFLLLLFILITVYSFAQGMVDTHYGLWNIRAQVQKIDKDSSLKMKELENEDFLGYSDNGNALDGYYKKDSICKIRSWIGLSTWTLQTEYYFSHEQLIFIFDVQKIFEHADSSGSIDYNNPTICFKGRYYFNNNKIIFKNETGTRCYDDGRKGTLTSKLLNDATFYLNMLKKKAK